MRRRAFWPLIAIVLALAFVLIPGAPILHAVGAVPLLLLLPGYAVSFLLFGPERPAGATAVVALAVSVAVTGLGGFGLALGGVLDRTWIIAVDAGVGTGAAAFAAWRYRSDLRPRRSPGHVWTRLLVVSGSALGVAIIGVAFALDVTSARQAQNQASVALSVITAGDALQIQVAAPDDGSFSGTLELKGTSTILRTWTLQGIPPGGRWTPSGSVHLPKNTGSLQLVLSRRGLRLRVVDIAPSSSRSGA